MHDEKDKLLRTQHDVLATKVGKKLQDDLGHVSYVPSGSMPRPLVHPVLLVH